MKLRPRAALLPHLLFGVLLAGSVPAQQKPTASDRVLVPRQTYHTGIKLTTGTQNNTDQAVFYDIAITPRSVVIGSRASPTASVIAFDRNSGRELWRRERTKSAGANDSESHSGLLNGSQNGNALFGRASPAPDLTPSAVPQNDANAIWYLVGTVSRQQGSVAVLMVRHASRNAAQQPVPEIELHGVAADTGRDVWQFALPGARLEDKPQPIGIYGGLIALLIGDHADFLDAFTGAAVLLSTPEGKAALKRAGEQYGSSFALSFTFPNRFRLLHLDTGNVQSVDAPNGYSSRVGTTADRGVILVNMDDDYAGHSVWPHYVYGVDGTGRTLWQFPAHILLPGADFDMATGRGFEGDKRPLGRDFEDVVQAQVVAASNIALVFSETRYQAQGRKLTGLRASDGRVLWRKPAGDIRFLRPYARGCFALLASGQLVYIDAATGQQQECGKLPDCLNILAADKDLFVVNRDGTVAAHDIATMILPFPAPRSHSVSSRRKQKS